MQNPPDSVHKFRAWKNVQHRPRDSVVCNPCKRSKLRCDRGQPCGTCSKKNVSETCTYDRLPSSKADKAGNMPVEDRLKHLEGLVKHLMQSQGLPADNNSVSEHLTTHHEASHGPMGLSETSIDEGTDSSPYYVGYTHWSAILDDVQELKMALSDLPSTFDTETFKIARQTGDREPLFGSSKDISLRQIVSRTLPSKSDSDRFVSTYFDGDVFIVPFLHKQQFQREYEDFWIDPHNVNPLWLSMLLSICYVGLMAEPSVNQSNATSESLSSTMLIAAGQCLVIGEYHRPQRFVVEALIGYAYCRNFRSLDPNREAGTIVGIAVRLAYEMGYHRDPDSFGSFTIFEGEMRRRLWATCKQMDVMMSFMLGLPSNIILENCDTRSPRNLTDLDFDTNTTVLPPSRPEDEETKILWFIVKDRQLSTFSKVCRDALSFRAKSEAEVQELDNEIRQMNRSIPEILQPSARADYGTEEALLILVKLYLQFISLKSLCVLHRKYMVQGNAFSTKTCVEAGKSIVIQFMELHRELGPGGRLERRSRMLTNFTMNDYLMGVMVLCHALHSVKKNGHSIIDAEAEQEIRSLLQQSRVICLEKSQASRDARRVSYAIQVILSDVPLFDKTSRSGEMSAVGPVMFSQDVSYEQKTDSSSLSIQPAGTFDSPFGVFDPFDLVGYDMGDVDFAQLFDQQLNYGMLP